SSSHTHFLFLKTLEIPRNAHTCYLREPLDCVRASELCNQNSQCSSRYRIMRQCLSGGDKERSAMLASKECQGALEVLQDSPLYDCRCKRGMKKELQCLQNYWSIHMGLTEGNLYVLFWISPVRLLDFWLLIKNKP
uniref:GDNF family receptor alpha 2 n=1 Tax=Maylandia zebra TaxID=106582 RepID=A0A3P9DAJ7_9CICH